MARKKVFVGMSGGKDSTAAVLLLQQGGFAVHGLHMTIGLHGQEETIKKLEGLARTLDIPLHIVDLTTSFQERIITYFIDAYRSGETPNPCAFCNRLIKFDLLMKEVFRRDNSAFYATGHYASLVEVEGRVFFRQPADHRKSQIYFLAMVKPDNPHRLLFPLADRTIEEVREVVKELPLVSKNESQDVCFLQNTKLVDYLRIKIPDGFRSGNILDIHGKIIGRHNGSLNFTIGQRRGTRFPSDRKLYVVSKDTQANTITLGEDIDLFSDMVAVRSPQYWRPLRVGERLRVKIRYLSRFHDAEITEADSDILRARFLTPVRAVTPGQIGVFYDHDIIVAAGIIRQ